MEIKPTSDAAGRRPESVRRFRGDRGRCAAALDPGSAGSRVLGRTKGV